MPHLMEPPEVPREKLICGLCAGEIGIGEPVTILLAGDLAHRFRSTCDWYRENEPTV